MSTPPDNNDNLPRNLRPGWMGELLSRQDPLVSSSTEAHPNNTPELPRFATPHLMQRPESPPLNNFLTNAEIGQLDFNQSQMLIEQGKLTQEQLTSYTLNQMAKYATNIENNRPMNYPNPMPQKANKSRKNAKEKKKQEEQGTNARRANYRALVAEMKANNIQSGITGHPETAASYFSRQQRSAPLVPPGSGHFGNQYMGFSPRTAPIPTMNIFAPFQNTNPYLIGRGFQPGVPQDNMVRPSTGFHVPGNIATPQLASPFARNCQSVVPDVFNAPIERMHNPNYRQSAHPSAFNTNEQQVNDVSQLFQNVSKPIGFNGNMLNNMNSLQGNGNAQFLLNTMPNSPWLAQLLGVNQLTNSVVPNIPNELQQNANVVFANPNMVPQPSQLEPNISAGAYNWSAAPVNWGNTQIAKPVPMKLPDGENFEPITSMQQIQANNNNESNLASASNATTRQHQKMTKQEIAEFLNSDEFLMSEATQNVIKSWKECNKLIAQNRQKNIANPPSDGNTILVRGAYNPVSDPAQSDPDYVNLNTGGPSAFRRIENPKIGTPFVHVNPIYQDNEQVQKRLNCPHMARYPHVPHGFHIQLFNATNEKEIPSIDVNSPERCVCTLNQSNPTQNPSDSTSE